MAEWKSASMSAFLPAGTTEIIDAVQLAVTTISTPIEVVADALDAAKTLITSLPAFDFATALRDLLVDFKENFLATGIYMLPMWDYPLRQLTQTTDYGPDRTYGVLNTEGTGFSNFIDDISRSIYDTQDINRPIFSGTCALLVLVKAHAGLPQMSITTEEDTIGQSFPQFGDLQGTANAIRSLRWQGAWAKMRAAIELSPSDEIDDRTDAFFVAFGKFNELGIDELDGVPTPNTDESDPYFEDTNAADIAWSTIESFIEDLSALYTPSEYPDWQRVSLETISPAMTDLVSTAFDAVIEALPAGQTFQSQIVAFIDTIRKRVEFLEGIVTQIDEILEKLDELIEATGYHAIFIDSTSGMADLVSQLRDAEDPFSGERMFYSGAAFVTGSANIVPFQLLFAPLAG